MHDEPHGGALLDVARRALLDEVLPALSGRPRFVALMVANALGIAQRELEAEAARQAAWTRFLDASGGEPGEGATALARAIRAGAHDGDPALHAALAEAAEIAAGISKPRGHPR